MPFREKMRRAFGGRSDDSADDLTSKRTKSQEAACYKPGEIMPRPKYPCRYNKPHQDLLKAFNFDDSFSRRRSEITDVSPMCSRAPSRRNSSVAPPTTTAAAKGAPRRPAVGATSPWDRIGRSAEDMEDNHHQPSTGDSSDSSSSNIDPDVPMAMPSHVLPDPLALGPGHKSFCNGGSLFDDDELTIALYRTSIFP